MSLIFNGHLQVKVLSTAGQVPTVPAPNTLTPADAAWVEATDILVGEFAWNTLDKILYCRSDDGIEEVLSGNALRGNYNPTATSTFPVSGGRGVAGTPKSGDKWMISVAGEIDGIAVDIGAVIEFWSGLQWRIYP